MPFKLHKDYKPTAYVTGCDNMKKTLVVYCSWTRACGLWSPRLIRASQSLYQLSYKLEPSDLFRIGNTTLYTTPASHVHRHVNALPC